MPRVAISPVTWGVDFADSPNNPPWEKVLDEIEQSGVGALELGPVGYLPEDPDTLRDILSSRSLTSVGSFIFDDLHDPSQADRILTLAERGEPRDRSVGRRGARHHRSSRRRARSYCRPIRGSAATR